MNRRIVLLSILFSTATALLGQGAGCDINAPEELVRWKSPVRPSLNSQERSRMLIHLNKSLPYQQKGRPVMGSIGQSVKLCDWIITGTVAVLQKRNTDDPDQRHVTMGINVESNLFGELGASRIEVDLYPMEQPEKVYLAGDKILVFLANADYGVSVYPWAFSLDFDKEKLSFPATESPVLVLDGNLSIIKLDDPIVAEQTLAAVDRYVTILRREKRDEDKIYAVLRELVMSPIMRVREDALSDLVLLLRHSKELNLTNVLSDDNIDEGIKDYTRQILIPDREGRRQ